MILFWKALSELGNSLWLLPAAALLIVGSALTGRLSASLALRWSSLIAVTVTIVLASKLAFMGWGLGSSALNFTGFSGHATMSACLYPSLAGLLMAGAAPQWRRMLIATGSALAAAIAYSRLPLRAHSLSEVIAGFALGTLVAFMLLRCWPPHPNPPSPPVLLVPLMALVVALLSPLPPSNSHQWVMALAKSLSGRAHLYEREWLHRHSNLSRKHQVISDKSLKKQLTRSLA